MISTTPKVLARIGDAVVSYRLNKNLSQKILAEKAGISLSTLKRLESGKGCSLENFIDVMRGLSRLGDFDAILPDIKLKPTELFALQKKQKPKKQRASASRLITTEQKGR